MSQLDLEIAIGAGQGSISRIENGQVNPTKETLNKISKILNLKPYEIHELFEISREYYPKLIRIANRINQELEMNKMVDVATNTLMKDLHLSGVGIFLVKGDYLHLVALDDAPPGRKWLLKLFGMSRIDLKISLSIPTKNIVVQSVLEQKTVSSNEAFDFTIDVLSKRVTDLIEKETHFKSGIVFPMLVEGESIGAVMFMKSVKENFDLEYDFLQAFTEYLSTTVVNIKKIESMKKNGE